MTRKRMPEVRKQKCCSAAVRVAVLLLCLSAICSSASAETAAPPLRLPPIGADQRAPQQTDDSTIPYPNGAQWQLRGEVWKLGDNTAGYAMWSRVETKALPLDVIGLYVSAAAVSAGGSGYAVNDTITLTGGAVLKVASLSGSAVATLTVQTPNLHTCAPTGPVPQQATSGSGSGATFTLTLLYPTAFGTRLLGRCYNGYALTAVRSDTLETRQIGFLADGSLDTASLDAFAQGDLPMALAYTQSDAGLVVPRISVWNDQGGQGNNATQTTAAQRPTIFSGRRLGNSRSVMFDAGTSTNWSPATTSMNLPGTVSVAGNNSTIVALSGHVAQYQVATSPVLVGSTAASSLAVGISFHDLTAGSEECRNHPTTSHTVQNYLPTDTAQVEICNNSASATTYANNYQSQTLAGGAGSSSTATGGVLGVPGNGRGGSGLVDEALVIIVPWSLDANTTAALQASIDAAFGLTPQLGGMIVANCDSQVSGYGSTFQQSWPRLTMELLGRRDIALVTTAKPGETLQNCSSTGGTFWLGATALLGYSGPNKWVLSDGGYNDINNLGASAATVEGYYAAAAASAHTYGAKFACVTTALPNGPQATITALAQVNAYLRANSGRFCDLVIDLAADAAVFGITTPGSQANPWWEAQDSYLHPSSQGAGLIAAIAAQALKGVLQ